MQQDQTQIIKDLQEQIAKLRSDVNELSGNFYKNNFPSHQDFNKTCAFSNSLKVPSYTTLPSCETGQILESGGKLYICSATNTWTVVGTQS